MTFTPSSLFLHNSRVLLYRTINNILYYFVYLRSSVFWEIVLPANSVNYKNCVPLRIHQSSFLDVNYIASVQWLNWSEIFAYVWVAFVFKIFHFIIWIVGKLTECINLQEASSQLAKATHKLLWKTYLVLSTLDGFFKNYPGYRFPEWRSGEWS